MEFEGKVAVITGAASGLGRSVALAMARLGTDIVVADIDDVRMKEVASEIESIGRRVLTIHCDVSKDADIGNLATQTLSNLGGADILMNNAAVGMRGFIEKLSMADWEWILGINLLGPIRVVHAFLPHMLERGSGYIVNIASNAALLGAYAYRLVDGDLRYDPYSISYQVAKGGLVSFSEGLYCYLRPKGIMVSVFFPSGMATNQPAHSRYVGDDWKERNELRLEVERNYKLPTRTNPDDVALILLQAMREERFLTLADLGVQATLVERGHEIQKLEKYLQDTFREWKASINRKQ